MIGWAPCYVVGDLVEAIARARLTRARAAIHITAKAELIREASKTLVEREIAQRLA